MSHEDEDESAQTQLYDSMAWLAPVAKATDLPADAQELQLCYVQDEERIYQFLDGAWGLALDD